MQRLQSQLDRSINIVEDFRNSFIESRYVQRESGQTIAYLSSHNGCRMACRFCHLTATGQTEMDDVTPEMFGSQLESVIKHTQATARLNINFMARGEPLANNFIIWSWKQVESELDSALRRSWGDNAAYCTVKNNISTIIPESFIETKQKLADIFAGHGYVSAIGGVKKNLHNNHLYWSLYSLDERFRKKWLNRAASPSQSLRVLEGFDTTHLVIHMAFIAGENDSIADVRNVRNFLRDSFGKIPRVNIVRYNPYSEKYGKESAHIDEISEALGDQCKIVDRVGFDVAASCGMFVEQKK